MIDFDGTISPVHGFDHPPFEIVVNSIKKLFEQYVIGIYSCRFNLQICDKRDGENVIKYLKQYGIPYDFIHYGKPIFTAVIDDRAFNPNHVGWDKILDDLSY